MKFHLLIITLATIYIWYPLSKLILEWESYTYITERFYLPLFTKTWISLANFDVQSMLTGWVLSNLFDLNIPLYFWVEIFFILVINIALYFLTKELTRSSTVAFIASFLFAVYFFGTEFFAPNYYATFLQRIIFNVPLLLASFLFLHRFLAEKKVKYYALSLSLFFLSIFLAHFGLLLAIPVFLYPFFLEIFSSFRLRSVIRALLTIAPYVLIAIFFLLIQKFFGENIGPKESIVYFLTHPHEYHYVEGVIRQLVYMSQYPSVVAALLSQPSPFSFIDPTSTYKFVVPIIIAYIISFIVVWKKNKKFRALLLTVVSSLILSLIINIYLNRFDVLNAAGQNRYYYYPSMMLAIFWSLLITSITKKYRFFTIGGILFGFFLINAALFRQYFIGQNRTAKIPKTLYEYIVNNYNQFPTESFVIVGPTADFGPYETGFLTDKLGKKRGITFSTEDMSYKNWRSLTGTAGSVIRLYYDKKCACVQKEILR